MVNGSLATRFREGAARIAIAVRQIDDTMKSEFWGRRSERSIPDSAWADLRAARDRIDYYLTLAPESQR